MDEHNKAKRNKLDVDTLGIIRAMSHEMDYSRVLDEMMSRFHGIGLYGVAYYDVSDRKNRRRFNSERDNEDFMLMRFYCGLDKYYSLELYEKPLSLDDGPIIVEYCPFFPDVPYGKYFFPNMYLGRTQPPVKNVFYSGSSSETEKPS